MQEDDVISIRSGLQCNMLKKTKFNIFKKRADLIDIPHVTFNTENYRKANDQCRIFIF